MINNRVWSLSYSTLLKAACLGSICFMTPVSAIANDNISINVTSTNTTTVKGHVTEATSGEPVIGATVSVKGEKQSGTVTDLNGNFSIKASPTSTLVITYIGFVTAEVPVGNQQNVSVQMSEDNKMMDEVVVIGYGTTRKADITGSISVMDNKNFRDQPITQAYQVLQGRVSGVNVETNGVPGGEIKIRVRGSGSINRNNDPLYVIDGIVRESGLTGLNSDDIQSIQVLKDASSTAIYGSRGSNGVILITTKTGKANQSVITFDASLGVSSVYKRLDILKPYEYATIYREVINANAFTDAEMEGYKNGTKGIDWQDELFQTGITQNYKVALSNGNDKSQYYLSANYVDQKGIIRGFSDKRYQGRLNVTSDITPWLHVTADVNASHETTHRSSLNSDKRTNIVWLAMNFSPTMEMRAADGTYNKDPYNSVANNPRGIIDTETGESMKNIMTAMVDLKFKILPNLTFSTTNGVDYNDTKNYTFGSTLVEATSSASGLDTYRMLVQSSNNLTYLGKWGKHNLTATGVWEATRCETRGLGASVQNLTVENSKWWNLSLGNYQYANSNYIKWTMLSAVGRLLYTYDDKYMTTVTFRADGSSKFTNKKWGYFPSVAFAWNLSNEKFMKDQNIFSNAKVRVSYGVVGNQAIDPYSTLGLMSAANTYFGGVTSYIGYWSSAKATPDVTWEKTKQFDLGVDCSVLDGKVDLSIDYFNRLTSDGLLQKTIPDYDGGGSYWVNSGKIRNSGIDVSITGHILNQKDLTWNSTLTGTYLRNRVVSLGGDAFIAGTTPAMDMITEITRVIPGESIGTFYGYKWLGIDENGNNKFEDIDHDGTITSNDRTVLGKSIPDVTLGWNNQVTYKNFELSLFLDGAFGAKKWNILRFGMASMVGDTRFITLRDAYYNGYDVAGAGAEYPSLKSTTNSNRGESSQWLEKADYVRLENLMIAYNLSKSVTKFANIKFYISAQNLFTITGYKGLDPTANTFSSANVDINSGVDFGSYPNPRTFTFGMKMDF